MPMNRKISSNGAPKRSASKLDRMPAITRTAPSRMAMPTESSDAMGLRLVRPLDVNACNGILIVGAVGRQSLSRRGYNPAGLQAFCTGAHGLPMAPAPRLWEPAPASNQRHAWTIRDDILTMLDFNEIHGWLIAAARSLGAEITSPWFYLQLGLIMAGSGLAFLAGAAVRSRFDMTSLAMGWPA